MAWALQNNEPPDQPERVSLRFLQKPRAHALRLILDAETYCDGLAASGLFGHHSASVCPSNFPVVGLSFGDNLPEKPGFSGRQFPGRFRQRDQAGTGLKPQRVALVTGCI